MRFCTSVISMDFGSVRTCTLYLCILPSDPSREHTQGDMKMAHCWSSQAVESGRGINKRAE